MGDVIVLSIWFRTWTAKYNFMVEWTHGQVQFWASREKPFTPITLTSHSTPYADSRRGMSIRAAEDARLHWRYSQFAVLRVHWSFNSLINSIGISEVRGINIVITPCMHGKSFFLGWNRKVHVEDGHLESLCSFLLILPMSESGWCPPRPGQVLPPILIWAGTSYRPRMSDHLTCSGPGGDMSNWDYTCLRSYCVHTLQYPEVEHWHERWARTRPFLDSHSAEGVMMT